MQSEQHESLRQEFLAIPKEQWTAKAFRVAGEYMKQSGMAAKHPDQLWDGSLALLKGVLLDLDRKDIFNDLAGWLERTSKPYWDERLRNERAAKAELKQASAQKSAALRGDPAAG